MVLYDTQFFPDAIHVAGRTRTYQPVYTAVYGVALALPGSAHTAGLGIHLKDVSIVPIHLSVATCGQAGDSSPDDYYRFLH
jgi:hypothetical protein